MLYNCSNLLSLLSLHLLHDMFVLFYRIINYYIHLDSHIYEDDGYGSKYESLDKDPIHRGYDGHGITFHRVPREM